MFVDFRGTSGDLKLDCALGSRKDILQSYIEPAFVAGTAFRACAEKLSKRADLTQFTTPNAVRDLDALRVALHAPAVDIEGGSYGTREALAYIHQYGGHVHAAYLSGLMTFSNTAPLHFAESAQRSLDRTLDECAADTACHRAFPRTRADLATVLDGCVPVGGVGIVGK